MFKQTSLFLLLLAYLAQQDEVINITSDVTDFSATCVEVIAPKEEVPPEKEIKPVADIPELQLIQLLNEKDSSLLKFKAIANCAQVNKGKTLVLGDTLSIVETDISIKTENKKEIDSLGNEILISIEIRTAEIVSCHCYITYVYQFSRKLSQISFLRFNEKTISLKTE